jgi:outer membrane receptor protein involved in Fe transport
MPKTVGANLFYRDITDVIQKTITADENNIITEQPNNTGSAYVAGLEVMSTIKPFDFWLLTASYSRFESEITSGDYRGDALIDQFKWAAKAITDVILPYNWTIQLSVNIVGQKVSNTKEESTIWLTDFGLEKRIMTNGKLSFRMTDIFDSLKKDKAERTDKSTIIESENTTGRIFVVGLSWEL